MKGTENDCPSLEEVPESQPVVVQPVDLPPPPPPPPKRPKLRIIRLSNPVDAWHETFREARRHFANDADTMDFLMGHEESRSLNKLATKIAVSEAKQKKGVQTLSPNEVGM
jgi:hypothetical protein